MFLFINKMNTERDKFIESLKSPFHSELTNAIYNNHNVTSVLKSFPLQTRLYTIGEVFGDAFVPFASLVLTWEASDVDSC